MRGVLKFENPEPAVPGRNIRVIVQDTSRAGGDAVDVAETTVTVPEDFDAALDDLSFEIDLAGPRAGLTLRAHLAAHGGTAAAKSQAQFGKRLAGKDKKIANNFPRSSSSSSP